MKKLGLFLMGLCTLFVVAQLLAASVHAVKASIDSYVDRRINEAIRTEREYVYQDLQTLSPKRVYRSRYSWHVKEIGQ